MKSQPDSRMVTTNVAVHTISFRGKAGIIFALLAASLALFVVGFSTVGWATNGDSVEGLWQNCTCRSLGQAGTNLTRLHAVQGVMIIGLISLLLSLLLITIYLCVHTVSKNSTIIALVCVCFISFIFMLIGLIIYGVEKTQEGVGHTMSWSFAVSVLASLLCFVAGIVSIVQMRKSGVRM